MSNIPDTCPECGHDDCAFVKYTPEPNDAQMEFARHSPNLHGVTCMDCGRVHAVVVADEGGSENSRYKVDEPLE